jgi:[ribosomal protein S5]-alanine N-acetyltransferase
VDPVVVVSTRIVPVTTAMADALLAGDAVFTERFAMAVVPGYLDVPDVLPVMRDALANGTPPEWYSHLIVDAETDTVVGFGGFKGPPVDGTVEIGYSIAPGHRERGHATDAVHLLLLRARDAGVATVCAHTLAAENVSTRLLTRCGFASTGAVPDAELGTVWRWELRLD